MNASQSNFVLTLSCVDRKGIVAAVANCLAEQDCNIVESAQYFDADSGLFFMRVCFAPPENYLVEGFSKAFEPVGTSYAMDWEIHDTARKSRVVIMVSKFGHCLNDLLYRHSTGQMPMDLVGVVSNHETWRARVESEGIPFHYLPVTKETKAEQESALLEFVEKQDADLVVLARYMQVLSDDICDRLKARLINIHHSFLPSFKGAKPYQRAHERGVKLIGATAHYVTPELDEGPIIEQDVTRVDHSMSADKLIATGRDIESQVLARAVLYHLEHRILLNGNRTVVFK